MTRVGRETAAAEEIQWLEEERSLIDARLKPLQAEHETEKAERKIEIRERRRKSRERLRQPLPTSAGQVEAEYVKRRGKEYGPYWYHYLPPGSGKTKRYVGKQLDCEASDAMAMRELRVYAREVRIREAKALRAGERVEERQAMGGTQMTEAEFRAFEARVEELVGMAPEDYVPRQFSPLQREQ